MAKHYLLPQLFTFFGWLSALDVARKKKEGLDAKDHENMDNINLRKEAAAMMIRSSQKHWNVSNLVETQVHGIGC